MIFSIIKASNKQGGNLMNANETTIINNTFKGYKRVTAFMLKTLEDYGLVISNQGKHYKVHRLDNVGGFVTLAKTPSDNRSGLNISRYIIQLIEA